MTAVFGRERVRDSTTPSLEEKEKRYLLAHLTLIYVAVPYPGQVRYLALHVTRLRLDQAS